MQNLLIIWIVNCISALTIVIILFLYEWPSLSGQAVPPSLYDLLWLVVSWLWLGICCFVAVKIRGKMIRISNPDEI